jgi:alkylation response protein AidB-like acyl-CoA dehydrogenase
MRLLDHMCWKGNNSVRKALFLCRFFVTTDTAPGAPLAANQLIQKKLADMCTELALVPIYPRQVKLS